MTQYPDERGKQYSGSEPIKGQPPYTSSTGQPNQPPYTGSTGQSQQHPEQQSSYKSSTGQSQQYSEQQPPYRSSTEQPPYRSSNEQPPYRSSASRAGRSHYTEEYEEEGMGHPGALGLGMLAFTIVMLGAFYASFILPSLITVRPAIAPILFAGGIVEILVGMWAFRQHSTNMGTIFTAYGGFLLALGYLFLPSGIIIPLSIIGAARLVLGFIYLCWTVFSVVLLLGIVRVNSLLRASLALMALAFLILAIGHFAYDNVPLLRIGGWIAIVTALVAWAGTALDLLGKVGVHEDLSQMKQEQAHRPVIAH